MYFKCLILLGILLPLPPSQEELTLSRLCQRAFLDNKLRKQVRIKVFRATFSLPLTYIFYLAFQMEPLA